MTEGDLLTNDITITPSIYCGEPVVFVKLNML